MAVDGIMYLTKLGLSNLTARAYRENARLGNTCAVTSGGSAAGDFPGERMAGMSSGDHVSFSTQAFRALASACRACVHITQNVTLQALPTRPKYPRPIARKCQT